MRKPKFVSRFLQKRRNKRELLKDIASVQKRIPSLKEKEKTIAIHSMLMLSRRKAELAKKSKYAILKEQVDLLYKHFDSLEPNAFEPYVKNLLAETEDIFPKRFAPGFAKFSNLRGEMDDLISDFYYKRTEGPNWKGTRKFKERLEKARGKK